MASAVVVKAWKDGTRAYLAVRVAEAGGDVEYIGGVALGELAGLTAAQQKVALVSAVKAARDRQAPGETALAVSGTVTV